MSSSISSGQNCTPIERSGGFRTAEFTVIKNRDKQLWWEETEQGLSQAVTHKMTSERPADGLVWRKKTDLNLRGRFGSH